jgi:2-dehydropantoate 2-reductase
VERVLIAGCGAIGSVFGAFLRCAGHDVTLLGRDWHLQAIRAKGLRVDGIWGSHHAVGFSTATAASDLEGSFDVAFVSVKSFDTASMTAAVAPVLRPDAAVVSLQNGLGNVEAIAESVGGTRALGASILVGARIPSPGAVTVTVQAAPIILGPLVATDASMEVAGRWAGCLDAAGIRAEATDQVLATLWSKVLYNAALNPLGALLEVHYGALGEDPDLRAIMDAVIEESFEVAIRKGVPLPWNSAAEYRALFYGQLVPDTFAHRSSMLQDLERGRRTEIQAINGQVCRYGVEVGVPTPYNELLTRLITWRERQPTAASSPGR